MIRRAAGLVDLPTLVVIVAMIGTLGTGLGLYEFFHQASKISHQQKVLTGLVRTVSAIQANLITTVKASANTRITTVTQRCELTALTREQALLVTNVVDLFLPRVRGPFDALTRRYAVSYAGCEKQLKLVKQIAAGSPTGATGPT